MNDMSHSPRVAEPATDAAQTRPQSRKKLFGLLFLGVAVVGGGWWTYDALVLSKHAVTDNAYVGADVAQVTPQVAAPVAEVLVSDTETVKRGDVLVRLDDTDARIALAQADAALDGALRRVRGYFASVRGLEAQVTAREADQDRTEAQEHAAEAAAQKAKIDFDRRRALAGNGSVSGDELTAVETADRNARANLAAAKAARAQAAAGRDAAVGQRDANDAMVADTTVEDHPEVRGARAMLERAQVDLERTVIRAPVDGVVSRRQVQVGQRVQPGMTLMVVVPLREAWVDANFKEVQLEKVRAGQQVRLVSDLWGSSVPFTGRVVGLSGGTGAAFSIVPAQNATGNWIKVVQRVPVRIALDPEELAAHPLQVGLSMTVDVDVSK